jgi:type IV pilus assembly protein PilV
MSSMSTRLHSRERMMPGLGQRGAYLLEALIGILIFSLGILGIVGLQAQAIRFTNDSEYRAEAVYLANSLISQMWTDDRTLLKNKYDSTIAGTEYVNFRAKVVAALGGATVPDPDVLVDTALGVDGITAMPAAPSNTSSVVQVRIQWQLPGDTIMHNYTTTGVIGQN